MKTVKSSPSAIHSADQPSASLTETTWAFRLKTPKSRASRARMKRTKPVQIQGMRMNHARHGRGLQIAGPAPALAQPGEQARNVERLAEQRVRFERAHFVEQVSVGGGGENDDLDRQILL